MREHENAEIRAVAVQLGCVPLSALSYQHGWGNGIFGTKGPHVIPLTPTSYSRMGPRRMKSKQSLRHSPAGPSPHCGPRSATKRSLCRNTRQARRQCRSEIGNSSGSGPSASAIAQEDPAGPSAPNSAQ